MGRPEPVKIVIIKKCPKLLRIHGIAMVARMSTRGEENLADTTYEVFTGNMGCPEPIKFLIIKKLSLTTANLWYSHSGEDEYKRGGKLQGIFRKHGPP